MTASMNQKADAFEDFCKEYNINLNEQQASAVKSVEGANLLIAVPGSGKTTVLVARLGYMIIKNGISPDEILAMTYTTTAAKDMKTRFASVFGRALAERLQFRTINSVCYEIIQYYSRTTKRPAFNMIEDKDKISILRKIYMELKEEYPTEADIQEAELAITYIKNMMLKKGEIRKLDTTVPDLERFYNRYDTILKENFLMDFDDQMRYSLPILLNNPNILSHFQNKFRYICVDEAQDTSKLQHTIIRILANRSNNIFMVGDEDQSIYGFRAAYPQALMDFKKDYLNPNILFMERNYRSTEEIVSAAAGFIAKNKNRYAKKFIATQGHGDKVSQIPVPDRAFQYSFLLNMIKSADCNTAVLYRDNDSVIPLVDLLLRDNIPYNISKVKDSFFNHRVVVDIKSFIKLALNPFDTDSFMNIYYKCSFGFNKNVAVTVCEISSSHKIAITTALKEYCRNNARLSGQAIAFERFMKEIRCKKPIDALSLIESKYGTYLKKNNIGTTKIDLLKYIAKRESDLKSFLNRIDSLPELIKKHSVSDNTAVILSTIHSAKGLEYDNVYIMDVYDGLFPSIEPDEISSEAEYILYEEERRLFYVGITRAKKKLFLLHIKNKYSSFIYEIFPLPKTDVQTETKRGTIVAQKNPIKNNDSLVMKSKVPFDILTEAKNYSAGIKISHTILGIGTIKEYDLLNGNPNKHKIKIEWNNGSIATYELETLLQLKLIKRI